MDRCSALTGDVHEVFFSPLTVIERQVTRFDQDTTVEGQSIVYSLNITRLRVRSHDTAARPVESDFELCHFVQIFDRGSSRHVGQWSTSSRAVDRG